MTGCPEVHRATGLPCMEETPGHTWHHCESPDVLWPGATLVRSWGTHEQWEHAHPAGIWPYPGPVEP